MSLLNIWKKDNKGKAGGKRIKYDTPWGESHDNFLIEHYLKIDSRVIAEHLGRSVGFIHCKASILRSRGLISARVRKVHIKTAWREDETNFLLANYEDGDVGEIAKELGRTEMAVYGKAKSMGLTKK